LWLLAWVVPPSLACMRTIKLRKWRKRQNVKGLSHAAKIDIVPEIDLIQGRGPNRILMAAAMCQMITTRISLSTEGIPYHRTSITKGHVVEQAATTASLEVLQKDGGNRPTWLNRRHIIIAIEALIAPLQLMLRLVLVLLALLLMKLPRGVNASAQRGNTDVSHD